MSSRPGLGAEDENVRGTNIQRNALALWVINIAGQSTEPGVNSEFPSQTEKTSPQNGWGTAQPLTIAFGIYRLLPRGGLEDNCIRIAEELDRRGHHVSLFVAGAYPDLPITTISLAPSVAPLFNHSRVAHFAKAFIAASKNRFDRTVAFQPVPGADMLFVADWIRNRAHLPLWLRLTPRFRTYAALEEQCFSASSHTRIIGLSEPQIRAYLDRYGTSSDRIAIVPPTLSLEKRKPERRTQAVRNRVRAEFGLDPKTPIWLWLGLQPAVKGLDRVLDALERHPQTHLLIGGLSQSQRKVRAFGADAMKRGVSDRVHWLGYVTGDKLLDCIAAADVLSHPARVDVTGGVILEAIVNGLPVVATSVCGFAGHIKDSGAGIVIEEPFDPKIFSAALADVCGAENRNYSAKGIAYGTMPVLYSGTAAACDLIEASHWPVEYESAGRPGPNSSAISGDAFRTSSEPPQKKTSPIRPR